MHTFRKYISNRGSALFMVISTMTALMITCMAMYFTVIASRSTIYATFSQKQSYQSAISLYDMFMNNATSAESDLRDMMLKMETNQEVTTKGSDELIGDYSITIKRYPSEVDGGVTVEVFDIVIKTTVNGVSETVHSQLTYTPPSEGGTEETNPSVSLAPTFAATGYVPNDVYLDKGHFRSDLYFDNEVTYFGAYDGSELFGYGDINCAGSVVMNSGKSMTLAKDGNPIVFSIRNNLTVPALGRDPGLVKGSKVYVGGNMYQYYELKNCDIYVNGDLYLYGGNLNDGSIRYFVNGNVYLYASQTPQIWCNNNVYDSNGNINSGANKGKWNDINFDDANFKGVMKYKDMLLDLDNRTQTNPYYKWFIPDKDVKDHKTITVEDFNKPAVITYGSSEWGTGCTVDNIVINQSGGAAFIIIDTGDDPDNVYTMRVMANRKDSNGNKTLFSWTGEKGDNVHIRVLVKGRGCVVIEVPEGVTYQDTDQSIIAHYNWWVMCGGQAPESYGVSNGGSDTLKINPDTVIQYVHKDCGEKCGGECVIVPPVETTKTAEEGGYCSRDVIDSNGNSKICNTKKQVVKCTKHGVTVEFCPMCERPYVYDSIDTDGKEDYIICKNHVDNNKVLQYYNNNKGKPWNLDSKGEIVYPNSNIFLVSSVESADFSFGFRSDGVTPLQSNTTIGYVYAPYVTFFANTGGSGNDAVKFMGGMTVSDYNFLSDQTFIMCVPDKNPTDLMDPASRSRKVKSNKDWKLELRTH